MTASFQKRFDQIIVTHIGCGTPPSSLRVMVDAIVCVAYYSYLIFYLSYDVIRYSNSNL